MKGRVMWRIRGERGRVGPGCNEQQAEEKRKKERSSPVISALSPCSIGTGNICVCEGRVGGWDLSAVITSEAPGSQPEVGGRWVYCFQTSSPFSGSPFNPRLHSCFATFESDPDSIPRFTFWGFHLSSPHLGFFVSKNLFHPLKRQMLLVASTLMLTLILWVTWQKAKVKLLTGCWLVVPSTKHKIVVYIHKIFHNK